MKKAPVLKKKTNFGYCVLRTLSRKITILKSPTMPTIVNGSTFVLFENPVCCKWSKNVGVTRWKDFKISEKRSPKSEINKILVKCETRTQTMLLRTQKKIRLDLLAKWQ